MAGIIETLRAIARPKVEPRPKKGKSSGEQDDKERIKEANMRMVDDDEGGQDGEDEPDERTAKLDAIMKRIFDGEIEVDGLLEDEHIVQYEDEKGAKFWRDGTPVQCIVWTRRGKAKKGHFRTGTLKLNPKHKGVFKVTIKLSPQFSESRESLKMREAVVKAGEKEIKERTRKELEKRLRAAQEAQLVEAEDRMERWAIRTVNHANFPAWIEDGERIVRAVAVRGHFLTGEEHVSGVDIETSLERVLHIRIKKKGSEFSEKKESRMKRIRHGVWKWECARLCSSQETHTWLGTNGYYGVKLKIASHRHQNPDYPTTGEMWDVWHDDQGVWHAKCTSRPVKK